eukprot:2934314-Rhodomonas_salina.1
MPSLVSQEHAWFSSPGEGTFTCYERHHCFPRKNPASGTVGMVEVWCDKLEMSSLMQNLV